MFGWLAFFFSGDKPGFGPAAELLFFASPKKSNQKKGEPRPCRLRGPLRYSQRSGHLQTRFAQTVQVPSSERCSVAQHVLMAVLNTARLVRFANFAPVARSLRELRPGCSSASRTSPCSLLRELRPASASRTSPWLLVRFANFALVARPLRELRLGCSSAALTSRGLGFPHFSTLTSRKGTARRATTPFKDSGRTQTSSFRAQSRNPCSPALQLGCCDYAQHDGVCRATLPPSPTPFPVLPHLPTMNS